MSLTSNTLPIILASQKSIEGIRIKIVSPKQMLQRLSIAFAQVKAGKASENLLNDIRQRIYERITKEHMKYN